MCSAAFRAGLLGAVLSLSLAAPAEAQTLSEAEAYGGLSVSETRAALEATQGRIDRLEQKAAADELRRAALTVDEARPHFIRIGVGPFVLAGDERLADEVVPGVEAVWAKHQPILGSSFRISSNVIGLYHRSDVGMKSLVPEGAFPIEGLHTWRLSSWRAAGQAQAAVILRQQLDGPVDRWSKGFGWTADEDYRIVLRGLLADAHPLVSECFQERVLDACADALFLDWVAGLGQETQIFQRVDGPVEVSVETDYWAPRVVRWYPDADGRVVAGERMQPARSRTTCASRDPDRIEACYSYASNSTNLFNVVPAPGAVRGSLLNYALRVGGDGAYGRLTDVPEGTTMEQRLEAASGLDGEVLLEGWLSELDQRAEGDRPPAQSLLWAGVFVLLSLTSTRWRLG